MVGKMGCGPVEAVGDRRAGRAPGLVIGPEHEVVDEQLRAALEQLGEARLAAVGVEPIILLDPDPRQRLALLGNRVALVRQRFLRLEQLEPLAKPVLTAGDGVRRHCNLLSSAVSPAARSTLPPRQCRSRPSPVRICTAGTWLSRAPWPPLRASARGAPRSRERRAPRASPRARSNANSSRRRNPGSRLGSRS